MKGFFILLLASTTSLFCTNAALADWQDAAPAESNEAPATQPAPAPPMSLFESRLRMANPEFFKKPGSPDTYLDYRVAPGQRLQIIEKERTAMPLYQGGFGKIQQQADTPSIAPSQQPGMIMAPGAQTPVDPMFEKVSGESFFGGVKADGPLPAIEKVKLPEAAPAWAKDKIDQKRYFIEGTEHHGNLDPGGFF